MLNIETNYDTYLFCECASGENTIIIIQHNILAEVFIICKHVYCNVNLHDKNYRTGLITHYEKCLKTSYYGTRSLNYINRSRATSQTS